MAHTAAKRKMDDYWKAEKDKKKLEELKRLGESKDYLSEGIVEAKKFVSPEIGKILEENKGEIVKNNWPEQLQRMCSAHRSLCDNKPPPSKPSNKSGVGISSLEKFYKALWDISWDIFTLVMGIIGLKGALTLSKDAFMKALQYKRLEPILKMDNLLVRLKTLQKNPENFFRELATFITEYKGYKDSFSAIIDAIFDATTADFWQTLKAVVLFFAQIIVWFKSGGLALVASIVLNAAAIYDLITHIGDAVSALEKYYKEKGE